MTSEIDELEDGDTFVGIVAKNKTEEVRVRFGRFKGHDFLDLRVYYRRRPDEAYRPSPRGLTIKPSKILDLINVLQEADRQARERGLLENAPNG